jgi:hypothetical protein
MKGTEHAKILSLGPSRHDEGPAGIMPTPFPCAGGHLETPGRWPPIQQLKSIDGYMPLRDRYALASASASCSGPPTRDDTERQAVGPNSCGLPNPPRIAKVGDDWEGGVPTEAALLPPTYRGKTQPPETAFTHQPKARRHAVRFNELLRRGQGVSGSHVSGSNSPCSGQCLPLPRTAPSHNPLPHGGAQRLDLHSGRGRDIRNLTKPCDKSLRIRAFGRQPTVLLLLSLCRRVRSPNSGPSPV